jgi:hypothetical protein
MLSKRSGRVFETDNYVVLSFADNIPSAHSSLTFVVRKES